MQTLCDGGGINEEATAQSTADIWVELVKREFTLQKNGTWGITVKSAQNCIKWWS